MYVQYLYQQHVNVSEQQRTVHVKKKLPILFTVCPFRSNGVYQKRNERKLPFIRFVHRCRLDTRASKRTHSLMRMSSSRRSTAIPTSTPSAGLLPIMRCCEESHSNGDGRRTLPSCQNCHATLTVWTSRHSPAVSALSVAGAGTLKRTVKR